MVIILRQPEYEFLSVDYSEYTDERGCTFDYPWFGTDTED